jgi:SAM-dependent methyltransferase
MASPIEDGDWPLAAACNGMESQSFHQNYRAKGTESSLLKGFSLFGLPGRFETANAEEKLPFADNTFDHVYSFGVIHHSPLPRESLRRFIGF